MLVYSCSVKVGASGINKLLRSIFCLLFAVEAVSLQKVVEMLEKVVVNWWEVRWIRWVRFIAQFVQLGCVTMAEHYRGELGPFCWPIPAAGIAVFDASYRFAEHTSQTEWFCQDSESCNESDGQQTTKQWPCVFLVQVWLWEVLSNFFSDQPLSWLSLVVI